MVVLVKKNILFSIPHLSSGGAEKILVDILNNLNYDDYNITLFLIERHGINLERLDSRIKVISSNDTIYGDIRDKIKRSYKVLRYFPKLYYRLNIKDEYDVEVAFLEGLSTKLIGNSNNSKSKKITWVHCNFEKNNWTKAYYIKNEESKIYNRYNNIIFVSNEAKDAFDRVFINNNVDKEVIYNPIIIDDIIEKSKEIDISFDKKTIIAVGRLTEPKGFDRLIKAHSTLVKEYDHDLIILGEGELRDNLFELISKLSVEDTVKMKGFIKNPYPFISAADIFVLSSISEGYPLVIGEALALEKPIVSTNISGSREMLGGGKYGMLCESSYDGLVNSLREILKSDVVFEEYKNKSILGKESLDHKIVIKKIESLLKS